MTKEEFIDKYTDEIPDVSCEYIPTREGMLEDLEKVIIASKLHQPTVISSVCDEQKSADWRRDNL